MMRQHMAMGMGINHSDNGNGSGNGNDWSDRRYDLSFEAIAGKLKFAQPHQPSWSDLVSRAGMAAISSILGQQLIFLLENHRKSQPKPTTFASAVSHNLSKTLRATEYSILLFTGKVIVDHLSHLFKWELSQYQKGGMVGLYCYLVNRPLDQLETARREILRNEGKQISRMDALRVVIRHDGARGLYKHENILAPMSAAVHRAIFFGLYHRIANNLSLPEGLSLLLRPFAASLGASASCFLIDKLRSAYLHVHLARSTAMTRRNKAWIQSEPASKEVLEMVARGEVGITAGDAKAVAVAVLRNWVMMAAFQLGQTHGISLFQSSSPAE